MTDDLNDIEKNSPIFDCQKKSNRMKFYRDWQDRLYR